jgi:Family of unknown function (DUF6463)
MKPASHRNRFVSPGYATMLVGAGHAAWGLYAYREPLTEIVRAGVIRSVGDGIFDTSHDRDARAAAFWFLFTAPMIGLTGYLLEAALRTGDTRTVRGGGQAILGLGILGTTIMPTSGFPAIIPLGFWLKHQSQQPNDQALSKHTHTKP